MLVALEYLIIFDPLQSLAAAMRVPGYLTYAFPLAIDGFIALAVYVLVRLRAAPLRVRAYAWTLTGIAIGIRASAVAVLGVLVGQQRPEVDWHVGDVIAVTMCGLAPLVLAGTVHLYVLVTRHAPKVIPYDVLANGQEPTRDGDG
ncbi:DUF2637 domain-containing protein [Streptomyces adelaidensis]|uniref:DUF2637 domain-containing protein n=1 Tax=Streptomyces adelaidensis TaxID=2796465 RepID=UPI0019067D2A|nr:DUF2637 domain-containing protein [Streptomyces adelaidensis]